MKPTIFPLLVSLAFGTLLSACGGGAPADLDFGHVSVIVISMGQKPTPGYTVDVSEGSVTLQGKALTISALWHQPPQGAVLPQVITSPCIAITVPTAQYSTVNVENQNGDIVIAQPI